MMQVFTENDATLRCCRQNEIGMPWEDRFSIEDYLNGICLEGQVGKPKQSPEEPDQPEMSEDMFEREMAAYKQDPAAYKARTPPGVTTKLFEIAERRRLESLERERVARVKPIEEMNAHELHAALVLGVSGRMLTTGPEDFARYLIERMGAVIALPDLEARQAALVEAVADIVLLLRNC